MKIIIINGSPRKNGATGKILMEMYDNLCKNPNTSVELIHLCNLNMKFCTGCSSCFSSGTCYINDDLEVLSEKIRNTNGIIIGSPTYASNNKNKSKASYTTYLAFMFKLLRSDIMFCSFCKRT